MANRTDTFNRANSSGLGNPSDGGSAWTAVTGTWDVNSNQALSGGTADNLQSLEASVADCDIQITCANNLDNTGLSARVSGAGNAIVLAFGPNGGAAGGVALYRLQSGSYTSLASDSAGNPVSGDTVKLNVNGTALAAYVNGSLRISTTSTFNQSTTAHGLFSYSDVSSRFDDFSITELSGGAATRGMPFGNRSTAFNGGRTFQGILT